MAKGIALRLNSKLKAYIELVHGPKFLITRAQVKTMYDHFLKWKDSGGSAATFAPNALKKMKLSNAAEAARKSVHEGTSFLKDYKYANGIHRAISAIDQVKQTPSGPFGAIAVVLYDDESFSTNAVYLASQNSDHFTGNQMLFSAVSLATCLNLSGGKSEDEIKEFLCDRDGTGQTISRPSLCQLQLLLRWVSFMYLFP